MGCTSQINTGHEILLLAISSSNSKTVFPLSILILRPIILVQDECLCLKKHLGQMPSHSDDAIYP